MESGRIDPLFISSVHELEVGSQEFKDVVSKRLLELESTFLEHLMVAIHSEQVKAIQETRLGAKKRKSVLHFAKVFPVSLSPSSV